MTSPASSKDWRRLLASSPWASQIDRGGGGGGRGRGVRRCHSSQRAGMGGHDGCGAQPGGGTQSASGAGHPGGGFQAYGVARRLSMRRRSRAAAAAVTPSIKDLTSRAARANEVTMKRTANAKLSHSLPRPSAMVPSTTDKTRRTPMASKSGTRRPRTLRRLTLEESKGRLGHVMRAKRT